MHQTSPFTNTQLYQNKCNEPTFCIYYYIWRKYLYSRDTWTRYKGKFRKRCRAVLDDHLNVLYYCEQMSCLLCSLKLRLTMLATIAVQDAHDETSLYTLIALSRYQLHVHHWVMLIQSNALNSPHHLCHRQSHAHEPAKINSLITKVVC